MSQEPKHEDISTKGERDLWMAVLERAGEDMRGKRLAYVDPEQARDEVEHWIGTEDFEQVCALAGVEAPVVERALLSSGHETMAACSMNGAKEGRARGTS